MFFLWTWERGTYEYVWSFLMMISCFVTLLLTRRMGSLLITLYLLLFLRNYLQGVWHPSNSVMNVNPKLKLQLRSGEYTIKYWIRGLACIGLQLWKRFWSEDMWDVAEKTLTDKNTARAHPRHSKEIPTITRVKGCSFDLRISPRLYESDAIVHLSLWLKKMCSCESI